MALKAGIIGAGGISRCHLHGYRELGDRVEVVSCCDIEPGKAKRYAEEYGLKSYYDNCRDMLANEQLDLVSVTTWNSAHAQCAIDALNAGCHVICEKPMAMNAREAQAMADAAEKNGKLLMIGFVRRHGNDAKMAKKLADDGDLGEIYFAKASYLRRAGFPGGWFGDKSRSGGGPLIDLGVHVIDLVKYVIGNPKPVSVYGATFDKIGARDHIKHGGWTSETSVNKPVFTVEDLAVAMIRFENGAVLQVETSFNLNTKNESGAIEIFGDKAGLTFSPFELHTEKGDRLADIQLYGDLAFHFSEDFDKEIKNFVDAVEGKAPCIAPAADGVALMKILDAIYESARIGRSVDIAW